jgi:hypothetical protein
VKSEFINNIINNEKLVQINELKLSSETSVEVQKYILETIADFTSLEMNKRPFVAPDDQSRALSLISHHNLEAIFQSMILQETVPAEIWASWKNNRIFTLFKNTQTLKCTAQITDMLAASGIESVIMRGLPLSHLAYPDPGMRPMHDIDVLISPDDIVEFERVMESNGHKPIERLRSQLVYEIEGNIFEFHWSVLTAKRYRNTLNSQNLIKRKVTYTFQEGTIYSLSNEDELIELILHLFVHHDLNRFLSLVDIALIIRHRNIDWNYIISFCKNTGLSKMFFLTLSFVNNIFDLGKSSEISPLLTGKENASKYHDAYLKYLFGGITLKHYFSHKASLLYVAESSSLKALQFFRFFSKSEFRTLMTHIRIKKSVTEKNH